MIWIPETIELKTKDEFSMNSIASQFEKRIHWFGLVLQLNSLSKLTNETYASKYWL